MGKRKCTEKQLAALAKGRAKLAKMQRPTKTCTGTRTRRTTRSSYDNGNGEVEAILQKISHLNHVELGEVKRAVDLRYNGNDNFTSNANAVDSDESRNW